MEHTIENAADQTVTADVRFDWNKARAYYTITTPEIGGLFVFTTHLLDAQQVITVRAGLLKRGHRAIRSVPDRYIKRPRIGPAELYEENEIDVSDPASPRLRGTYRAIWPATGRHGWVEDRDPRVERLLNALAAHLVASPHFAALATTTRRLQAQTRLPRLNARIAELTADLQMATQLVHAAQATLQQPFSPPQDAEAYTAAR